MHLSFDFILTEVCHLLDVSAMVGHGAVLAVLLFYIIYTFLFECNSLLGPGP